MTNDEILEIALKCGADVLPKTVMYFQNADIEKFAGMIASAEREACAKVCETLWQEEADAAANGTQTPKYHDAIECASAIRARSDTDSGTSETADDLSKCPQCGGDADNGHDRCYPPTAYLCSKCCELHNAGVTRG